MSQELSAEELTDAQNSNAEVDSKANVSSNDVKEESTNSSKSKLNDAKNETNASKTYTEEELNKRIDAAVKARIDKQNTKHSDAISEREKALEDANVKIAELEAIKAEYEAVAQRKTICTTVAQEVGLEVAQVELLRGDTEEELKASANAFKAASPNLYPAVSECSTGGSGAISKDDILKIKNTEERIAAMAQHKDLFS